MAFARCNLCIFVRIMSKRIIVSVTNELNTDQRVHKVCTSLQQMGFDVLLVGRRRKWSLLLDRKYATKRMSLLFNNGILFYAEYNLRLFFFLLFVKCDVLLSNDLDTLLANHLASALRRTPLVYDSHELFPEAPELQNRPFVKGFWEFLERRLLPKQKYAYTVCQSIANFYRDKYGVRMEVLRNVPFLLEEEKKSNKEKTIIYQGAINPGRGLELAIQSLSFLKGVSLLVVGGGKGKAIDDLKQLVNQCGLENRVDFVGWVPQEELKEYTKKASLGLLLEEPLGLSFEYALPNKLFDYIHAEISFVATPLLEVKKVVEQYQLGELLKSRNPKDLATQIERLLQQEISSETYQKAKKELCWQKEEVILKKMFSPFLS